MSNDADTVLKCMHAPLVELCVHVCKAHGLCNYNSQAPWPPQKCLKLELQDTSASTKVPQAGALRCNSRLASFGRLKIAAATPLTVTPGHNDPWTPGHRRTLEEHAIHSLSCHAGLIRLLDIALVFSPAGPTVVTCIRGPPRRRR